MHGIFELIEGVFALLGVLGLLALIAWDASRDHSTRRGTARSYPEEAILRKRFARGEITSEEYKKSLETLREDPPETPPHRSYEDYVREAMGRLKLRRDTGS